VIIKRAVHVKVVVTDEFKRHRAEEMGAAIARLDAVRKRLDFELESVAKRADLGAEAGEAMRERLRAGQRKNERARAALADELKTVESLEIGAEYHRGSLEGLVEVRVGDDFARISSCEIVVKDDKIVEIRDGLCPEMGEISR